MCALVLAYLMIPVWNVFPEGVPELSTQLKIDRIIAFRKERNEFLKNHPRSPLSKEDRRKFRDLDVFPIDLKYVFAGKIDRYNLNIHNPDYYATFPTNKGTNKRYVRYGKFTFELNGKTYRLELYKSILSDSLFVPFRDKTNGTETYEMGRYIDAEILPGYHTVIDFNMAYSPNCMFNDNFTCPIPPEENSLSVRITAGEKKYKNASEGSQ
ncbi:MAG: DUF1684 domain-containing protein [Proteobacteria bacterium]|nr:DUF1684 domain-containing protein [Pseudomonadota bacterium]